MSNAIVCDHIPKEIDDNDKLNEYFSKILEIDLEETKVFKNILVLLNRTSPGKECLLQREHSCTLNPTFSKGRKVLWDPLPVLPGWGTDPLSPPAKQF